MEAKGEVATQKENIGNKARSALEGKLIDLKTDKGNQKLETPTDALHYAASFYPDRYTGPFGYKNPSIKDFFESKNSGIPVGHNTYVASASEVIGYYPDGKEIRVSGYVVSQERKIDGEKVRLKVFVPNSSEYYSNTGNPEFKARFSGSPEEILKKGGVNVSFLNNTNKKAVIDRVLAEIPETREEKREEASTATKDKKSKKQISPEEEERRRKKIDKIVFGAVGVAGAAAIGLTGANHASDIKAGYEKIGEAVRGAYDKAHVQKTDTSIEDKYSDLVSTDEAKPASIQDPTTTAAPPVSKEKKPEKERNDNLIEKMEADGKENGYFFVRAGDVFPQDNSQFYTTNIIDKKGRLVRVTGQHGVPNEKLGDEFAFPIPGRRKINVWILPAGEVNQDDTKTYLVIDQQQLGKITVNSNDAEIVDRFLETTIDRASMLQAEGKIEYNEGPNMKQNDLRLPASSDVNEGKVVDSRFIFRDVTDKIKEIEFRYSLATDEEVQQAIAKSKEMFAPNPK